MLDGIEKSNKKKWEIEKELQELKTQLEELQKSGALIENEKKIIK